MAECRRASKTVWHGVSACRHARSARLCPANRPVDWALGRIRFRFVLMLMIMARDQLWTGAGLPVDGLGVRLRGFRKSHHLILAGPGRPQGLQSAATRNNAPPPAACVSKDLKKIEVETACPCSKASLIP